MSPSNLPTEWRQSYTKYINQVEKGKKYGESCHLDSDESIRVSRLPLNSDSLGFESPLCICPGEASQTKEWANNKLKYSWVNYNLPKKSNTLTDNSFYVGC